MTTDKTDFGKIFSDLITSSNNNGGGLGYPHPYNPDTGKEYEDCESCGINSEYRKLKSDYDELKSEFNLYKKRVQNTLDNEKKRLKQNIMKDFINDFVTFIVNTYKSKKWATGSISDEEYLILEKLDSFLDANGVVPMKDCTGDDFDYKTMDAIMQDPNSTQPSGKVTKVIYNGFMMDGEVILPQRVSVAP